MKAVFKLSLRDTYRRLLYILNAFQEREETKLTDSEIELLSEFLILPRKRFEYQPFSTLAKNKVMEATESRGWKLSRENINNKIYALVQKNYLWRDEDGVVYLKPHIKKLVEQFRRSMDIDHKYSFIIEFNEAEATDKSKELQNS